MVAQQQEASPLGQVPKVSLRSARFGRGELISSQRGPSGAARRPPSRISILDVFISNPSAASPVPLGNPAHLKLTRSIAAWTRATLIERSTPSHARQVLETNTKSAPQCRARSPQPCGSRAERRRTRTLRNAGAGVSATVCSAECSQPSAFPNRSPMILPNAVGRLADAAASGRYADANAMALATSTPDGRPSVRIVLCKAVETESGSLTFFTNYLSRKGRELAQNPHAAVVFHWPHAHRQARVEGTVERLSDRECDDYFRTRPLLSRIGATVSRQSGSSDLVPICSSGGEVAAATASIRPARPDYWGGSSCTQTPSNSGQARPSTSASAGGSGSSDQSVIGTRRWIARNSPRASTGDQASVFSSSSIRKRPAGRTGRCSVQAAQALKPDRQSLRRGVMIARPGFAGT